MIDDHTDQVRSSLDSGADTIRNTLTDAQSRRKFLMGLGSTGILSLAGCASGGEKDAQTSSSGSGTNNSQSSSSTLRMNATQRFGTIDPAKGTDYTQTMALVNLYDGLVFPDTKGEIKPHLAKEWSVSDDNKTYTFTLRKDATFHSGNPVRAEDVKFTVERFFDLNQGYSSLLQDVLDPKNITVKDEQTIEFTLNRVYSPFLATLVLLFIVDKKAVMKNKQSGKFNDRGDYGQKWLNSNDAGSGAYQLKSFERQSQISFSKFDDYWMGWDENPFNEVQIKIITKDPTVRSLMKTGKLDMTSQYQSQETYDALKKQNGVRVETIPTVTVFYMKMNTQKAPTDDPAVREAIAYGFDYKTARNEIASGSEQAVGPLAPSFDAHNGDIPQPTYNPKKAKQILKDAGYSEGDLKINNTYVKDYGLEKKMGLLFQQNMSEIGIDVELNPQTWGTMTELATKPDKTPHVNQVFYGPVYPSPDTVFYNQYHSGSASTWMSMAHLEDEQVDSLIDKARKTVDAKQRKQIYYDLQKRIVNLHPDLFVFVQAKKHAFAENVQGYKFRPSQSYDYWFHNYSHK
ncbi:ABC transporter substrate-binding protein [Haladaptatus sp. CMAA 1911]|uniref:ABC transporter substrate-binding protein n=1 Tax=unclassified Haladaptatus TaxID=2622732 RepID=UPI003754D426